MNVALIGGGDTALTHSADEIGAKADNLARMAALGLPVPPAFVLPVSLCARIVAGDATAERQLDDGLRHGIDFLEKATGKRLGDRRRPLLVSVRSGAARSMPGMMDTSARRRRDLSGRRRLDQNDGRPTICMGLSHALHRKLRDRRRRHRQRGI
jgi:pyruvate,orthophosphate dikinase